MQFQRIAQIQAQLDSVLFPSKRGPGSDVENCSCGAISQDDSRSLTTLAARLPRISNARPRRRASLGKVTKGDR